ncbi:MAG: 30S ribosomal protein S9 [Candidatus Micrarchaeota archaeon]|nr:30S ribosomal protein S9 [Candidatus Micrarchaeota archaeon]
MAQIKKIKKGTGKKAKKPKLKELAAKGKRKRSVARAVVRAGTGIIRINGMLLECLSSEYVRAIISQPLSFTDKSPSLDVEVNVYGGGVMGQAQACRSAIAKALVKYMKDDELKRRMNEIDRHMLTDDVRKVEPKKFRGPKARARFQKSYR